MSQSSQSPLRYRKTRRWRIWRPHPRRGRLTLARRTRRSKRRRRQAREDGQKHWRPLDDPGRSSGEGGDIAAFQVSWISFLILARSGGKGFAFVPRKNRFPPAVMLL